ncbi:MAG: PPOX class F420-dependent oxidoreductase [Microlunatus sp.]|nr:PPOX class F420-dependent oxidoreductase [Microlunatus sp.]MDN5769712.1 PPOX class F420-dependent oxidoreductase [Microlunatus sp.]MDN5804271.1 PPOX class F420-dependent oxidoreductase [Microlunatus sp.]
MALDPKVITFAQGPNFAMLTTLRPDGHPVTQPMWVDADADHVLINTEKHRRKFRNVVNDPRVTVTIWDRDNPYSYVEVRGTVTGVVYGDEPRRHIDQLAEQYIGQPYKSDAIRSERVILQITPLELSRKSS